MKFIKTNQFISGIAIPLGAVHTLQNTGCGEFSDLPVLAKWCAKTGFNIIQILPVNDTGLNASPYSALSGFALNPIYLNIQNIESSNEWKDQINKFKKSKQLCKKIKYQEVYHFKLHILNQIYKKHQLKIAQLPEFLKWVKSNDWLNIYGAFKILSEMNHTIVWSKWNYDPVFNENSQIKNNQLRDFLNINKDRFYFYAWIQYLLETQLIDASLKMGQLGVNLKGDLPILIDKESCDVWFHRELFNMNRYAGAPPDQFATDGQNWGFPVYNLDQMKKDQFFWWKKRIGRINLFYHAIRLDHIIGFMRLWQFSSSEPCALMGFFSPSDFITSLKLSEKNIKIDEIKKLSKAAIDMKVLENIFTWDNFENFKNTYLDVSPSENLYYLKDTIKNENDINYLSEHQNIKDILHKIYRNKIFIEIASDCFAPFWGFQNTGRFLYLSNDKKIAVQNLVDEYYHNSEKIWYENGNNLLSVLQKESNCIFCGEDLGNIPKLTQVLLNKLGILSLKVLRWSKHYHEPDSPFIDPEEYPLKSVATTSVHDSENLRQWWSEDHFSRNELLNIMGYSEDKTSETVIQLHPDLAAQLLKWFFNASSEIVILPIQDLFSIDEKYRIPFVEEERINIPGQVLDSNWAYKMPCSVESLFEDHLFIQKVQSLTNIRFNKKAGLGP
ncbi:MAG: 4-alpha-glucanotransferase [Spirochaetia bacterium]|nr:4-alpha-glucanotransferase [Spirochaetia bacterium]